MQLAIKIMTSTWPIILQIIKDHHSDKNDEDHKQIAQDIFNSILKN